MRSVAKELLLLVNGLLASGGERTAGDLAAKFDSARPTVSRHLRVLREAGIVRTRSVAQERYYTLEPATLEKIETWLSRQRQLWALRLNALDAHLERASHVKPDRRKSSRPFR